MICSHAGKLHDAFVLDINCAQRDICALFESDKNNVISRVSFHQIKNQMTKLVFEGPVQNKGRKLTKHVFDISLTRVV